MQAEKKYNLLLVVLALILLISALWIFFVKIPTLTPSTVNAPTTDRVGDY